MTIVVVSASIGERRRAGFFTPTVDRRPDGVRYLAFSATGIASDFWEPIAARRVLADPVRDAKRFKVRSIGIVREHVPDVSRILWVDRHCRLECDPLEVFAEIDAAKSYLGVIRHSRGCVYREGRACIAKGKDDPKIIASMMQRFRDEGFRHRSGLFFGGWMAFKVGEPSERFLRLWWNYIETGSRRDQLSMPVAIARSGIPFVQFTDHRDFFSIKGH